MLELFQFPWSPYCFVPKLILDYCGVPFKSIAVPPNDRTLVWKATRERYYGVPILRDGREVVFETDPNSQVICKYLDFKFQAGLFPAGLEGVQSILWRYIENDVEEMTFKLNDAHYCEFVPKAQQLAYLRHKERKFGAGCIDHWRENAEALQAELTRRLLPFEDMLLEQPFLLGDVPRFVDFDLHGMLGNFLFTGHYGLPAEHGRLKRWYEALPKLKHPNVAQHRKKLRS